MTHDDIIRLAQEVWSAGDVYIGPSTESLERFAALVAAAERERLAMVFDKEEDRPYYGRHVAQKLRKLGAK
jgi:hypothetical protein